MAELLLEALIYTTLLLATCGVCLTVGLALGILILRRQPQFGGKQKHRNSRRRRLVRACLTPSTY